MGCQAGKPLACLHGKEDETEDVGPSIVGFPVSTVAEPLSVRVKDASSIGHAVPELPRRTNCGRCAQCCVNKSHIQWQTYKRTKTLKKRCDEAHMYLMDLSPLKPSKLSSLTVQKDYASAPERP
eukprot:Skav207761  [mRNA]  locus=scaffold2087:46184:48738:- [translate_table: standard]